MGPYQRTPFSKLRSSYLDTQVCSGSVDRGSCWRFLGYFVLFFFGPLLQADQDIMISNKVRFHAVSHFFLPCGRPVARSLGREFYTSKRVVGLGFLVGIFPVFWFTFKILQ